MWGKIAQKYFFSKSNAKSKKKHFLPTKNTFFYIFQVPFIVLVTVFSYLKAIRSLVKTNTVNINGNQLDDIKRLRREKEFHATKFHSLESHGQSFFQIILQTYFLFLLLLLGTGTVIAGVNAETFFKNICKSNFITFFFKITLFSNSIHM